MTFFFFTRAKDELFRIVFKYFKMFNCNYFLQTVGLKKGNHFVCVIIDSIVYCLTLGGDVR